LGRTRAADRSDKQTLPSPKKTGAVLQFNEPLSLFPFTVHFTALEKVHIVSSQCAEHKGWRMEERVAVT